MDKNTKIIISVLSVLLVAVIIYIIVCRMALTSTILKVIVQKKYNLTYYIAICVKIDIDDFILFKIIVYICRRTLL